MMLCGQVFGQAFAQEPPSDDALAALQGRLVSAAADIRAVERQLQSVEDHLAILQQRSDALEKDYNIRRTKMASTLAALTRMGRTPREAVMIRPGGPLQAARTSMLLSSSLPAIESEAASFRVLLTDLERTKTSLRAKAEQARSARFDLKTRHEKLTALLDDRRRASSRDMIVWGDESRAVAALAHDAQNLRDLLSQLDVNGKAPMPDTAKLAPIEDGEGQLPVSGIVRIRYGQPDGAGARSSGLSIETLAGSLVVAPLGGIVRYAGAFKGYGNIVIIAHAGGFHSLVAGLDKISVSAGQTIVSGEPIGILGTDDDPNQAPAPRKTVYYELRRHGQPVDPSRKLPNLG